MDFTFAPAAVRDIGTIFDLSKVLIDEYENLQNINYDKVLTWVRRKIEVNIASYTCIFYRGQKAGFYRFCPNDTMMEIDDLYILPEFRNQGIGTFVIRKCCSETNLPVMLYVFTRNTGALSLYRRLGFQVTQAIGDSRCIMVRNPEEAL